LRLGFAVLALLLLAGCANDGRMVRTWWDGMTGASAPKGPGRIVYCYPTIGEPDCYAEPRDPGVRPLPLEDDGGYREARRAPPR